MAAILTRFNYGDGAVHPTPQYLCRDTLIFAPVEWYWSEEREQAHVFAEHKDADAAAREWRERDHRVCFACGVGGAEELRREHAEMDLARGAAGTAEPGPRAAKTGWRNRAAAEAKWQEEHDQ